MDILEFLRAPTITLHVGLQQPFAVHESLVCSHSVNIATALKPGRFKEGEDRSISFPNDDPAVFATYLTYLYRPEELKSLLQSTNWHNSSTTYTSLCATYSLSEILIDDTMKDDIYKVLHTLSHKQFHCHETLNLTNKLLPPPVEAIQTIYNGPSEGDRMRALLTELFTDNGYDGYVNELIRAAQGDLPAGFTHDFAVAVMHVRATPTGYLDMSRELHKAPEDDVVSECGSDSLPIWHDWDEYEFSD